MNVPLFKDNVAHHVYEATNIVKSKCSVKNVVSDPNLNTETLIVIVTLLNLMLILSLHNAAALL